MSTKFNIEVSNEGVHSSFFQFAKIIRDDDESTVREKNLAELLIMLGNVVNQLASDLNHGTATVVVHEADASYGKIQREG